jgi:hypothetical protein
MRRSARLGCLSNSAIASALVVVLIFAGITLLRGGILFSPGALNAQTGAGSLGGVKTHADIQDCAQCHPAPFSGQTVADRCLVCHTDLKTDPHNFHNIMVAEGEKSGCTSCHTDHRGSNASLTLLDPNSFPHDKIGFSLKAHPKLANGAPFQCAGCHPNGYVSSYDQAVCSSCHNILNVTFTQNHIASFGQDCLACHDGIDSFGHNFNHTQVVFSLTGKHTSVACGQCHSAAGSTSLVALKTTAQDCASCHAKDDPHQGNLGQNCAQCHTPAGWTPSTFDHSQTAFALIGKHQTAACTACHVNTDLKNTPQACAACHAKDDAHQGDLGQNCDLCHTPAGWLPANIDHNLTRFPLVGKHISVDCAACHVNNVFRGTPQNCYACHAKDDTHQGDLGQNCAHCHTSAGWLPATMDHNLTSFPLVGKHVNADCTTCHINGVYKGTPKNCYACHAKDDTHQGDLGQNCGACHTPAGWLPATMDHNLTSFPLVGKHASAACTACHTNGVFKGTPKTCYACHAANDAHKGQFGQDCGMCHSPTGWLPATFDHSKVGFPLTGAHAGLPCTSCHANAVFKGTPATCSACHAEPAYHAGLFGLNCASCHNTSAWVPAKFNGAHTFPINHGGAGSTCRNCHPTTLQQYTCFKCHDQAQTIARHQNQGIANISNCIACHPTGNGGDGGGN